MREGVDISMDVLGQQPRPASSLGVREKHSVCTARHLGKYHQRGVHILVGHRWRHHRLWFTAIGRRDRLAQIVRQAG